MKYVVGKGLNDKVELYALWILLKTEVGKGLKHLQEVSDSKIFMDWTNNKCRIENILLNVIMAEVMEVKSGFKMLYCAHIEIKYIPK